MFKFEVRDFSRRPAIKALLAQPLAIFTVHDSDRDVNGFRGTAVAIIREDGRFYVGTAVATPEDTFVKKVGRAKALGRAVQAMVRSPHGSAWYVRDLKSSTEASLQLTGHLKQAIHDHAHAAHRRRHYSLSKTQARLARARN